MGWTPGPWTVGTTQSRDYMIGPKGVVVAYAAGHSIIHSSSDLPLEANAHLIAAAPNLYLALQTMVDRYIELANSGDCGNWDPETEVHIIAAREALAEATNSKLLKEPK